MQEPGEVSVGDSLRKNNANRSQKSGLEELEDGQGLIRNEKQRGEEKEERKREGKGQEEGKVEREVTDVLPETTDKPRKKGGTAPAIANERRCTTETSQTCEGPAPCISASYRNSKHCP